MPQPVGRPSRLPLCQVFPPQKLLPKYQTILQDVASGIPQPSEYYWIRVNAPGMVITTWNWSSVFVFVCEAQATHGISAPMKTMLVSSLREYVNHTSLISVSCFQCSSWIKPGSWLISVVIPWASPKKWTVIKLHGENKQGCANSSNCPSIISSLINFASW